MIPLPRPRCVPGERVILHVEGDPWDGCVLKVVARETSHLGRCRLTYRQRKHAKAKKDHHRVFPLSDLF